MNEGELEAFRSWAVAQIRYEIAYNKSINPRALAHFERNLNEHWQRLRGLVLASPAPDRVGKEAEK